jgi:O-antigen ligase
MGKKNKRNNFRKKEKEIVSVKLLNILIYSLIIFMCMLYNKHSSVPAGGPRWILLILSSTLLPLIVLIRYYQKLKEIKLKFTLFHLLLLMFFVWLSASRIWTVDKMNFVENFIYHLAAFLLLLFFSFYGNKLNSKILIYLFAFIITFVSSIGLLQYYGLDGGYFSQSAAPASIFVNKNLATPLISLFLPFLLFTVLFSKNKKIAILFSFGLSISLAYLVIAATRSSWVAVLTSMIFVILIQVNSNIRKIFITYIIKPRLLFILGAFILMFGFIKMGDLIKHKPLMTTTVSAQIESMFNIDKTDFKITESNKEKPKKNVPKIKERKEHKFIPKEKNPTLFNNSSRSIRMRIAKWRNSFEMLKDFPLKGIGLGSFAAVYPKYHKEILPDEGYEGGLFYGGLHNDLYQYTLELGVIGLLIILLFFLLIFKMLLEILGKKQSIDEWIFYLASFTGIIAIIFDSMFNYPLRYPTYIFLLTVIIGKTYAKNIQLDYTKFQKSVILKLNGKVNFFLILFILLSGIAINISHRKSLSEKSFGNAISSEKRKQLDKTWYFLKQSANYWPYKSSNLVYASAICFENYRKDKSTKKYREACKYNKLALENLPYHYIPNYIELKLLLENNRWKAEKNIDEKIQQLLDVMPKGKREEKTFELVAYYAYLKKDYEASLTYYKKLRRIKPKNRSIRKRIKMLKKLIVEKEELQ